MRPVYVAIAVTCALTVTMPAALRPAEAALPPQGQAPLRLPATTPAQAPQAPTPPGPTAADAPTTQSLGLPIYPAAQYIATYDAGRDQKYVLFGTTSAYAEVVAYYRNQLKTGGDQVFREPLTHVFEVGRFREETMAFPPGVTVKDWTSGGSQGYPHPQANAQTVRYPTVIMVVPQPPAPSTQRK